MKRSHIPTALDCFSDHSTANEASPAKYQESHAPSMHGEQLQLSGSSRGANTRSLTATRTFRVLYADPVMARRIGSRDY
jgi:hypothetical protein